MRSSAFGNGGEDRPRVARGLVAVGQWAVGGVAVGIMATGFVVGVVATGIGWRILFDIAH